MRLRSVIFLTFSMVTVLPVAALAAWIFTDALDREMESVRNKHLVIAKNVGEALDRYSVDLQNGFALVAQLPKSAHGSPSVLKFMRSLQFNHFCIANLRTGAIVGAIAPQSMPCPKQVPKKRFRIFLGLLEEGRVVFSPVMTTPKGQPAFYMLQTIQNRLYIGAVSTKYIVKQGKAVAFGKKGHAAIVDQTGRVMAHPLPAWRAAIKNIAKVAPVQRMMARQTGTMVFFSPALKADMVTGYTFVPTTGWGVMIPQPLSEVRATAVSMQNSAIGIAIAGIMASALLSWFLSGIITRSLSSAVAVTQRMAAGDLDTRINIKQRFITKEFKDLSL
ncbi:MAG: hypothetical protein VCD66_05895 [Alphaproteobacteria bacterium]